MRPYQPVHNVLDEVKTITPGLMDQIFDTRTKGRLKDSIGMFQTASIIGIGARPKPAASESSTLYLFYR